MERRTRRRILIVVLACSACIAVAVTLLLGALGLFSSQWVLASGSVAEEMTWSPDGVLQYYGTRSWLGRSGICVAWDQQGAIVPRESGSYVAGYRTRGLDEEETREFSAGDLRIQAELKKIMGAALAHRAEHGGAFPASVADILGDGHARRFLPEARNAIQDPWGHPYSLKCDAQDAWTEVFTLGRDGRLCGVGLDADHAYIVEGHSRSYFTDKVR